MLISISACVDTLKTKSFVLNNFSIFSFERLKFPLGADLKTAVESAHWRCSGDVTEVSPNQIISTCTFRDKVSTYLASASCQAW